MKKNKLTLPAVVLIASLVALALPATAQVSAFHFLNLTNLPPWPTATLTNGTAVKFNQPNQGVGVTTNLLYNWIKSGLGIQSIFAVPYNGTWTNSSGIVTNSVGVGETIYVYPTVDGTNALPLWATLQSSTNPGTNAVIFGTNWSEFQLRGFYGLFFTVSNSCSLPIITGGTITNLGPTGTTNIYNAGVLFNQENL